MKGVNIATNYITLLCNNLNVAAINNNHSQHWQLLRQSEVVVTSSSVNAVYACGSQVQLLMHSFAIYFIKFYKGSNLLINQFHELLQWFENSSNEISADMLKCTNTISMNIYQFFETFMSTNNVFLQHLSLFKGKACV